RVTRQSLIPVKSDKEVTPTGQVQHRGDPSLVAIRRLDFPFVDAIGCNVGLLCPDDWACRDLAVLHHRVPSAKSNILIELDIPYGWIVDSPDSAALSRRIHHGTRRH